MFGGVTQLRVAKLEKDVFELKKIDYSAEALASLKSQVPTVVDNYPGSKIESEKSALEISKIKKEQAEKKKMPKMMRMMIKTLLLDQSALFQTMNEKRSFPANHALYHALMEALIEDENAMDKGFADTVKKHKR
ncbi:hypothetical protein Tco_0308124 [Tanacetum coccineum]